jgi:hypothetical protein
MVSVKFKEAGAQPGVSSEIVKVNFGKLYDIWTRTPRGQHLSTDAQYVAKKTEGARDSFEGQLSNGQVVVDSVVASFVDSQLTFQDAPMGQVFNLMNAVQNGRVKPADIGSISVRVPTDQVPQFKKDFAPT